jgi:hypothetical protein
MLDVMAVVVIMFSLLMLTIPDASFLHVLKVHWDLSERHKKAGMP